MKEYEIKTLEDVLRVVNDKNVDNFLVDFERWLKIAIATDALTALGIERKNPLAMLWIDDGKTDIKINVEIDPKA